MSRRPAAIRRPRASSAPTRVPGGGAGEIGGRHDLPAIPACTTTAAPRVVWKRDVVVEPATAARWAFLAARGLGENAADPAADPLLAVAADAWAAMTAHARSASVEVGGFLVGAAFRDEDGRWLVDVRAAIPAHGALEEAAYFKLTEAAWDHVSRERAALHPDLLTVGWYHTHPGFGAFFSGTDRAAQAAFFNRPWNVGVVIDPGRDDIALFRGGAADPLPVANLVVYDGFAPDGWTEPNSWRTARDGAGAVAVAGRQRSAPHRGGAPATIRRSFGVGSRGAEPGSGKGSGGASAAPAPERVPAVADPAASPPAKAPGRAVPWLVVAPMIGGVVCLVLALRAVGRRGRRRR